MRYIHGCKPRNPYNMIIQENHAADRANLIISYLFPYDKVKEAQNPVHAIDHEMREYFAKKKNKHVNDNKAVLLY